MFLVNCGTKLWFNHSILISKEITCVLHYQLIVEESWSFGYYKIDIWISIFFFIPCELSQ